MSQTALDSVYSYLDQLSIILEPLKVVGLGGARCGLAGNGHIGVTASEDGLHVMSIYCVVACKMKKKSTLDMKLRKVHQRWPRRN